MYERKMKDILFQRLFWRNTKASVGSQLEIPNFVHQVIWMEPTDVEKAMFQEAQGQRLRLQQLCCHPQISQADRAIFGSEKKSLTVIREDMMGHLEKSIRRFHKAIADQKVATKNHYQKLRKLKVGAKGYDEQYEEHQKAKKAEERLKEELDTAERNLNYFKQAIPDTIQSITEPCPICFEVTPENMAISTCGHLLCVLCFSQVIIRDGRCPICRKHLRKQDVTPIGPTESKEKESQESQGMKQWNLKMLVEKNGTKMGHLISFIKKAIEDEPKNKPCRFIVFSQWDNMLHLVSQTLSENGLKNVFVSGSSDSRNRAISTFKTDAEVRVIMLSLKNAASGTNLTEATHIIFTDPVDGKSTSDN